MKKIFAFSIILITLLGMLWANTGRTDTAQASGLGAADCAKLKLKPPVAALSNGKPRVNFTLINQGTATFVKNISFDWKAYRMAHPNQSLQRWLYDHAVIYTVAVSNVSPSNWQKPNTDLLPGEQDTFNFDFAVADPGWPGNIPATSFGLKVTLGNGCIVTFTSSVPLTPTPTGTATLPPGITPTPTGTPTPKCFDC